MRILINPGLRNVKVNTSTMVVRVVLMLMVEGALLAAWSSIDSARLYYAVTIDATDADGKPTESHGSCTADDPWPFMGTLLGLHVALLIYGNVLCCERADGSNKGPADLLRTRARPAVAQTARARCRLSSMRENTSRWRWSTTCRQPPSPSCSLRLCTICRSLSS